MTQKVQKVEITDNCALVCVRYGSAPDVSIRYNGPADAWDIGESVHEAEIDADDARAMIALLVAAFGPAVLPGAGGEN